MLTTTVMKAGPTRFNMVGQRLDSHLHIIDEVISQGMAQRLYAYALKAFDAAGFLEMCRTWQVEVYTVDGHLKGPERSYCVQFKNEKGGYIELIGIETLKGWPTLDYGLAIGQD